MAIQHESLLDEFEENAKERINNFNDPCQEWRREAIDEGVDAIADSTALLLDRLTVKGQRSAAS